VNVAGKCLTNYSAREQPLDAPIRAEGAKPPGNPWRPGGSGGWERLGARVSVISIALFFALVFGTRLTRINIKASIGCGQRARPRPDQARCSFGAAHSSSEPALLNPFAYKQTRPYSERLLVSRNQPNGPEPLSGRGCLTGDLVREDATVGAILLWLLGIPIPVIILLLLLWH
jgi:hypothetical protein